MMKWSDSPSTRRVPDVVIYILCIFSESVGEDIYIYVDLKFSDNFKYIFLLFFFLKHDHRFSNISRSIFGCLASLDEIVFI